MRDTSYVESSYVLTSYTENTWKPGVNSAPTYQITEGPRSASGRYDLKESNGVLPTFYGGYRIDITAKEGHMTKTTQRRAGKRVGNQYVFYYFPSIEHRFGKRALPLSDLSVLGFGPSIPAGLPPDWDQELKSRLQNKLLNKMLADINLGNSLGELYESAELMAGSFNDLINFLNALRKKDASFLKKHHGVVPSKRPRRGESFLNWFLAYKLGWQPLLNDIFNGYQAVMAALARDDHFRVEARVERSRPFGSYLTKYRFDMETTMFMRGGMSARITDPNLAFLSSIGLANPFALAWELTPLSFVFDYIVNAGSFLNALGAHQGVAFTHGYISRGLEAKGEVFDWTNYLQLKLQGFEGTPVSWHVDLFTTQRTTLASFPLASVHLGNLLFSVNKAAILAALSALSVAGNRRSGPDLSKYDDKVPEHMGPFQGLFENFV